MIDSQLIYRHIRVGNYKRKRKQVKDIRYLCSMPTEVHKGGGQSYALRKEKVRRTQ